MTSPLPTDSGPLYHRVSDNPYAAIPSLHEGYAMLVFLFIVMLAWRMRWRLRATRRWRPAPPDHPVHRGRLHRQPLRGRPAHRRRLRNRGRLRHPASVAAAGVHGPSERHADRGPLLAGAGAPSRVCAGCSHPCATRSPCSRSAALGCTGCSAAAWLDVAGATGVRASHHGLLRPARPAGTAVRHPLHRRARGTTRRSATATRPPSSPCIR